MTEETRAKLAEGVNPKQAEYERRRRVWRYVNDLPGPQEPPCQADAQWINGPTPAGRVVTEGEW
jgi:hypothetical protein